MHAAQQDGCMGVAGHRGAVLVIKRRENGKDKRKSSRAAVVGWLAVAAVI